MTINLLAKSFTTAGGIIRSIDPAYKLPTTDGKLFELVEFTTGHTSYAIRYTIDGEPPAEDRCLMIRKGPDMRGIRLWSGPNSGSNPPLDHEAIELLHDFCVTLEQQEAEFWVLRRLQAKAARGEMPDIAIGVTLLDGNTPKGPN